MSQTDAMVVFDRRLVRRHRDRAATHFAAHAFLFEEVGERLIDRLALVRRRFGTVLELGCRSPGLGRRLAGGPEPATLVSVDLSPVLARQAAGLAVAADEEALPFPDHSFDLVISNLGLHWVNDLPGALLEIRRCLRPDGFFLAAFLGGATLTELRRCLLEAEAAVTGGASPRVSPFARLSDAAGLLQRAGFALPVADADALTVTYPDAFRLMADLRGMGEGNAVLARRLAPAPRRLFLDAARRYRDLYADSDGRLPATFEVLYLAGWAPHPDQPRPLPRGSARVNLAEAIGRADAGSPDSPPARDADAAAP